MAESREESSQSLAYRALMGTALAMISFGQFNDTKELLGGIYGDIKTNFTHQIEYEQLDVLSIGRTLSFIEDSLGPPEVVKQSSLSPDINFQYYNLEKAVVTVMAQQARVVGYIVIPTIDSFAPEMPYLDTTLGQQAFAVNDTMDPEFFFDANNLIYFAESQDLGKQFLFLQRVWGFVEYGQLERTMDDEAIDNLTTIDTIRAINALYIQEDYETLSEQIYNFRLQQTANFYAYTEVDVNLVPEALLTRFEFSTYFGTEE